MSRYVKWFEMLFDIIRISPKGPNSQRKIYEIGNFESPVGAWLRITIRGLGKLFIPVQVSLMLYVSFCLPL